MVLGSYHELTDTGIQGATHLPSLPDPSVSPYVVLCLLGSNPSWSITEPILIPSQSRQLWGSPPRPPVPDSLISCLLGGKPFTLHLGNSVAARPYSHLLLLFQELQPRAANRSAAHIPPIPPQSSLPDSGSPSHTGFRRNCFLNCK